MAESNERPALAQLAKLNAAILKYPCIAKHVQASASCSPDAFTKQNTALKSAGFAFPSWIVPYFILRNGAGRRMCTRLNHPAGYGCSKGIQCAYMCKCLLCGERGHGAFSSNKATNQWICKFQKQFDIELDNVKEELGLASSLLVADLVEQLVVFWRCGGSLKILQETRPPVAPKQKAEEQEEQEEQARLEGEEPSRNHTELLFRSFSPMTSSDAGHIVLPSSGQVQSSSLSLSLSSTVAARELPSIEVFPSNASSASSFRMWQPPVRHVSHSNPSLCALPIPRTFAIAPPPSSLISATTTTTMQLPYSEQVNYLPALPISMYAMSSPSAASCVPRHPQRGSGAMSFVPVVGDVVASVRPEILPTATALPKAMPPPAQQRIVRVRVWLPRAIEPIERVCVDSLVELASELGLPVDHALRFTTTRPTLEEPTPMHMNDVDLWALEKNTPVYAYNHWCVPLWTQQLINPQVQPTDTCRICSQPLSTRTHQKP